MNPLRAIRTTVRWDRPSGRKLCVTIVQLKGEVIGDNVQLFGPTGFEYSVKPHSNMEKQMVSSAIAAARFVQDFTKETA